MKNLQVLENRVEAARLALNAHTSGGCGAAPGSLDYQRWHAKFLALNTAYLAAVSTLHQFELPVFDSPLFGALLAESVGADDAQSR